MTCFLLFVRENRRVSRIPHFDAVNFQENLFFGYRIDLGGRKAFICPGGFPGRLRAVRELPENDGDCAGGG
jgi:hypothetical protein